MNKLVVYPGQFSKYATSKAEVRREERLQASNDARSRGNISDAESNRRALNAMSGVAESLGMGLPISAQRAIKNNRGAIDKIKSNNPMGFEETVPRALRNAGNRIGSGAANLYGTATRFNDINNIPVGPTTMGGVAMEDLQNSGVNQYWGPKVDDVRRTLVEALSQPSDWSPRHTNMTTRLPIGSQYPVSY